MARRDDREYREYLREEQRRQPGCPARELCRESLRRDTSHPHVDDAGAIPIEHHHNVRRGQNPHGALKKGPDLLTALRVVETEAVQRAVVRPDVHAPIRDGEPREVIE